MWREALCYSLTPLLLLIATPSFSNMQCYWDPVYGRVCQNFTYNYYEAAPAEYGYVGWGVESGYWGGGWDGNPWRGGYGGYRGGHVGGGGRR